MVYNVYSGLTTYYTANTQFGQGSGPIFFADIQCNGFETSILECSKTAFIGTVCTHDRDVGVECQRKYNYYDINYNHLY